MMVQIVIYLCYDMLEYLLVLSMRLGRMLTVVMWLCSMGGELAIFRAGKFWVERPAGGRGELGTKVECKILCS